MSDLMKILDLKPEDLDAMEPPEGVYRGQLRSAILEARTASNGGSYLSAYLGVALEGPADVGGPTETEWHECVEANDGVIPSVAYRRTIFDPQGAVPLIKTLTELGVMEPGTSLQDAFNALQKRLESGEVFPVLARLKRTVGRDGVSRLEVSTLRPAED